MPKKKKAEIVDLLFTYITQRGDGSRVHVVIFYAFITRSLHAEKKNGKKKTKNEKRGGNKTLRIWV